ncbi:MAG: hypothetical protein LCI03_00465 [Actinobacteria bacterium]|jgi:hypothetical protein|nr:hypothetical protein [Actinomycetota bacterium]
MKTRLARTLAAVAATAGLVAGGLAAAAPASAASLCSTDCISSLGVTTTTKSIDANVTTTGFVKVSGEIWDAGRTTRVGYMWDDQPLTWERTWPLHSNSATSLKQGTYYQVRITATDMLGKTWTEWKTVRVKQRTATYYITRIDVSDDGDYFGAGEFNGSWKVQSTLKTPIWSTWQSKSSGGYWTFSESNSMMRLTRSNEGSTPTVWLQLTEDDTGDNPQGTCGGQMSFYSTFVTSSNQCGDWAHGGTQLLLPEYSATRTFTIAPGKAAPTQWKVTGKVVTTVS